MHRFDFEAVHIHVLLLALQHLQVTPDTAPQQGHVSFNKSEMEAYSKLKDVFALAIDVDKIDLDTIDGQITKENILKTAKAILKKM